METDPWTLRFARRLRARWPHVPPEQLEELAAELAADPRTHDGRNPEQAAQDWLRQGVEAP